MTGNKFIAILAAMVAGGAALAVAALYIDWQRLSAPPASEQTPVAADGKASDPSEPQAAAPSEGKRSDATSALTPPSEPTTVPSFDVVVIEPSGEGVIAGRAAPGWSVSVQSGGVKVAEAKADLQGEWSVVLEKPLPGGDHALSLKIVSPDGTRAVSSQETVKVAVGSAASPVAPAPVTGAANVASPSVPQAGSPEALAAVEPDVARALTRAEQEALAASAGTPASAKPALVFRTVDYELSNNGAGTITITGTSEPGAAIVIFYGKERLTETRADRAGSWKVAVAKTLGMGEHSFRAERTGAAPGTTVAAVISIERAEPKPEPAAPEVAARDLAAAGPASQAATPGGPADALRAKEVYTIRRGDTLWAIAKRYLGSGLRYTAIFQDNRGTINNPNLIHPQQEVSIPDQ
jgi:nucleoid-associated protein YgaU